MRHGWTVCRRNGAKKCPWMDIREVDVNGNRTRILATRLRRKLPVYRLDSCLHVLVFPLLPRDPLHVRLHN